RHVGAGGGELPGPVLRLDRRVPHRHAAIAPFAGRVASGDGAERGSGSPIRRGGGVGPPPGKGSTVTTLQTEYTYDELLESHRIAEPLFAGGTRCHGGFDDDGAYVSPRTKNRRPAIRAWQEQHREQFGTPLLDISLDTWPEHYP